MDVEFRGTRDELNGILQSFVLQLLGSQNDTDRVRSTCLAAVGLAALADIHKAYIVKSRGGIDEMGIQWPPLSPATIANRRVGKKDLDDPTIKHRQSIERSEFARLFRRYKLSMEEGEARRAAITQASRNATKIMGMSKVQVLGGREVEILRDTGRMINSLVPGEMSPSGEVDKGNDDQIFDVGQSSVTIGTNVEYAPPHQTGAPRLPRRQFLPTDYIPPSWWDNWMDAAAVAMQTCLARMIQG